MIFNNEINEKMLPLFEFKGFQKAEESEGLVSLKSEKYSIRFSYDYNRSYEMNVFIGSLSSLDSFADYEFYEIQDCFEIPLNQRIVCSSDQIDVIKKYVSELHVFFSIHFNTIFTKEFFQKLEINRKINIGNYKTKRDLIYYLEKADKAWIIKDYKAFRNFLLPFEDSNLLPNVYKKKLEIAKSRSAGS